MLARPVRQIEVPESAITFPLDCRLFPKNWGRLHISERFAAAKRATWAKEYPDMLNHLSSRDPNVRLAAIHSMKNQISGIFIPVDLDSNVNAIISDFLRILKSSPPEHDDTLILLCCLCLQQFSHFNPHAKLIIGSLLPRLSNCDALELFAVGFIASFGLADEEHHLQLDILRIYLDLMSRDEFDVECLKSLTLMLAVFDPEHCLGVLFERILHIIDDCLLWTEEVILLAAIDLVMVVYEGLHNIESQPIDIHKFTREIVATLRELPRKLRKKHEQKALARRCREVEQQFNGEIVTTKFGLNPRRMTITGARNHVALAAIKRACGDNFQQQMFQNRFIHIFFGNDIPDPEKWEEQIRHRHCHRHRKVVIAAQRRQKDDFTDS
jgi:hypothetical protein